MLAAALSPHAINRVLVVRRQSASSQDLEFAASRRRDRHSPAPPDMVYGHKLRTDYQRALKRCQEGAFVASDEGCVISRFLLDY